MAQTEATIPDVHTKGFLSVMKLYADMVGEGNMTFSDTGLTMGGMDQSHVCLLRTFLPDEMLKSSGGGYAYCGEDITVGIPYKIIAKILGAFSNPEKIKIGVESGVDAMNLTIDTKDGTSRFVIKLMELDEEGMEIPEMEYDVSVNVPFKILQKAFGQAETLEASSVNFVWIPGTDENEMRLRYKTDVVDADVVVSTTPSGPREAYDVSLVATYPRRLFAAGQMSNNVRVAFSKDIPVLFRCEHNDPGDNPDSTGYTELYVAPRIDEDLDADADDDYTNHRE